MNAYRYKLVKAGTAKARLAHAQLKSVSNCSWSAISSHKRCKISSGRAGAIFDTDDEFVVLRYGLEKC
jgi:hypothetical protein